MLPCGTPDRMGYSYIRVQSVRCSTLRRKVQQTGKAKVIENEDIVITFLIYIEVLHTTRCQKLAKS